MEIQDFARIIMCAKEYGFECIHIEAGQPVRWKRKGQVSQLLHDYIPTKENISRLSIFLIREDHL